MCDRGDDDLVVRRLKRDTERKTREQEPPDREVSRQAGPQRPREWRLGESREGALKLREEVAAESGPAALSYHAAAASASSTAAG